MKLYLRRIIRVSKKVISEKNIFLLTGDKSDPEILDNICKKHKINFFLVMKKMY